MDLSGAIAYLKEVVDGTDPQTGELLDRSSDLRRADIIGALDTVLNSVPIRVAAMAHVERKAEYTSRWSDDMVHQMLEMFDEGDSVQHIADHLKMSCVAIESRLRLAGRLPVSGVRASIAN